MIPRVIFLGNWQNRVYPGGVWTKSGTFFFATGRAYARMQNASKTRSGAWTHYALCARSTPKTVFSVFDPSKQRQWRRPKSALHEQPDFVQEHTGIPCPVLRFYKRPDFVHTAPDFVHTAPDFVQFCKTRGDTETDISPQPSTEDLSHNWQVADCDDCDAAAAALLTSRPTKIRRDWWTTCRPDETALRSMVAWPSVSEDTQPRSGARTKRQDHVETLHLLLRTFSETGACDYTGRSWKGRRSVGYPGGSSSGCLTS